MSKVSAKPFLLLLKEERNLLVSADVKHRWSWGVKAKAQTVQDLEQHVHLEVCRQTTFTTPSALAACCRCKGAQIACTSAAHHKLVEGVCKVLQDCLTASRA